MPKTISSRLLRVQHFVSTRRATPFLLNVSRHIFLIKAFKLYLNSGPEIQVSMTKSMLNQDVEGSTPKRSNAFPSKFESFTCFLLSRH